MNPNYLEDTETGLDEDGCITDRAWNDVIHQCDNSIDRAVESRLPTYANYAGRPEFDEDVYIREEIRNRLDMTIVNEISQRLRVDADLARKLYDDENAARVTILKETMLVRIVMRLRSSVYGLYRVYDDFDDGGVIYNDERPGGLWSLNELKSFLRSFAMNNLGDNNDRIIARCIRVEDGDTVVIDSLECRR